LTILVLSLKDYKLACVKNETVKKENFMKKLIAMTIFWAVIFIQSVPAQSNQTSAGFRGQSINGATGLFSIPSGRLAWETPSKFSMDFGYHMIINNDLGIAHVPAVTMGLFGWVEISSAYDIQPRLDYARRKEKNDDLLMGIKVKLPTGASTAITLGSNFQFLNINNDHDHDYNAFQPYIAITFPGIFFKVPAETTIVFGKTFYSGAPHHNNTNIDFGMGFDVILFPGSLKNLIHWIIDFSNFNYSDNAWPNSGFYQTSSVWRGILNTGFRFDLSSIPELSKFKFLIDVIFNDLFDEGSRSFTTGAVFGFSVK